MTAARAALIWGLVAGQAARRGEQVAATDVCAAAVEALPVSGAWMMAQSRAGAGHIMCVTDEVGEQLAELQMTLGEGPCLDVLASGAPVLISDLDDGDSARRWPGFTPQACGAGVAAIFALPLQIGAIRVGSIGLYREKPGPLDTVSLGDALILADAATVVLLESQDPDGAAAAAGAGPAGQPPDLAHHRAEIDQATGMVSEQLDVAIGEAFVRLRAYAYAQERRLSEVARDIVARRLRLSPDPDPPRISER
jgi:ANTAR domain-containing protein/GAF domain-containing protein